MTTVPPTGRIHAPAIDTGWAERAPATDAMYNPALIACLLSAAAGTHLKRASSGLPVALSFIVTPMALHRDTRQALTATTVRTHLRTWAERNPMVRVGFPERAQDLVPVVRQGLRFALRHHILGLNGDMLLPQGRLPHRIPEHPELEDILRTSRLLGRWLAVNDPAAVFALLGVTP
ncbi:three component ABC system middle component [Streptomyces sp. NPDC050149]|uniref:three component ABC system middle component n=1 Tax=Streptomyces sp. NPDC050149 TaxID=3365603 RepID=UPI0037BA557F